MIDPVLAVIPLLCIAGTLGLLVILAVIDLREFLLPDRYVFPFAALGILFHAATGFTLLPMEGLAVGALFGAGILLLIRALGNAWYKQDTLGLGDVKLMGAAGLWLGMEGVTQAMTLGAAAGLVHGLFLAIWRALRGQGFHLRRMVIPAGPGFIVGILAMMTYMYGTFLLTLLESLIS